MEYNNKKIYMYRHEVSKDAENIDIETEEIKQLLKNEERANPEYRECKESLRIEFERRAGKANEYIEKISKKIGKPDWFIVPPVMSRTDYGYMSDIDLVIISDSIVEQDEYKEGEVFITPRIIKKSEVEKYGSAFPELADWYDKKIKEEKPKGTSDIKEIDVLSLEDKLRYSLSKEKRERIRNYRIKLADHFIEAAKKRVDIVSWNLSGSTADEPDKFSACSDLDFEILVDPSSIEEERTNDVFLFA